MTPDRMTPDRPMQIEGGRQDPSAGQLRVAIESMADGFMIWDADRRLVAWNERLLESPHLRGVLHVASGLREILGPALAAGRPKRSEAQRARFLAERLAAFGEERKPSSTCRRAMVASSNSTSDAPRTVVS